MPIPIAFHPKITPPPPSDRPIAPRPDRFRQAGHRGQSPSVFQKYTSKPSEIRIVERRWYSGWNSFSRNPTESVLRPPGMTTTLQQQFELFKVTAQDQLRTQVHQTNDRNTAWMDERTLSFKYPAVPRHNSVEWFLIVGGIGRKEGRQACYFSAAHRQNSNAQAQDMGLKFFQTFSYAVVHFGVVVAQCIARVVAHDQTILHERPSEVTQYDRAIHEDFRASTDQLLDPDQKQMRLDLISSRVCPILQAPHRRELEKKLMHVQRGVAQ